MPFTFSTEAFTKPLADFGNDAAQMILQTGATIQQGLHQMMTNRQVAALGQQLGTLNPESPEWAQQAVKLGSQYPLAMKSPAGQFMLGTQAKAHAQWQQAQTATARQQTQFGNSVALENMRQRNRVAIAGMRPNSEVDLSEIPLPSRLTPQNPAAGVPFQGPMQSGETLDTSQQNMALSSGTADGNPPLPDANVDPLTVRALRPLAEAQRITGSKPSKAQVFGAIAGERTRAQQEKMQEDRQAATEAAAAKRDEAKASIDEAVQQRMTLTSQLTSLDREITQKRAALNRHLDSKVERDDAFFARKAELESVLEEAGLEQTRLKTELEKLGKRETTETGTPTVPKSTYRFVPGKGVIKE